MSNRPYKMDIRESRLEAIRLAETSMKPVAVALIITAIRTVLEDRTLQEELPGYRDYARRVRYRLIPGVF